MFCRLCDQFVRFAIMGSKPFQHLAEGVEHIVLVVAIFSEDFHSIGVNLQYVSQHTILRLGLSALTIVPKTEEVVLIALNEVFESCFQVLGSFESDDEVDHLQHVLVNDHRKRCGKERLAIDVSAGICFTSPDTGVSSAVVCITYCFFFPFVSRDAAPAFDARQEVLDGFAVRSNMKVDTQAPL